MRIPALLLALAAFPVFCAVANAAPVSIFDGKTFDGWEGDTAKTWRIEDGCLVGGSLEEKNPRNEFLATKKRYRDFEITLKFKLTGTEGFVNSGVQFRSVRIDKPENEMSGYQADIGEPEWWGCLYDESRRNKVIAKSDMTKIAPVLKKGDWNEYKIRCEGPRIQIWLDGVQTVDFTEADAEIAKLDGFIALQIHGGAKSQVRFKDIVIEELGK